MTGWNMPPGVNVSDIPGNRPEDLAEEAFWEKLAEAAPSALLPEEWWDDEGIAAVVEIARDLAFTLGYAAGQADAFFAREAEAQ